jgi:hypothetical protein
VLLCDALVYRLRPVPSTYSSDRLTPLAAGIRDGGLGVLGAARNHGIAIYIAIHVARAQRKGGEGCRKPFERQLTVATGYGWNRWLTMGEHVTRYRQKGSPRSVPRSSAGERCILRF